MSERQGSPREQFLKYVEENRGENAGAGEARQPERIVGDGGGFGDSDRSFLARAFLLIFVAASIVLVLFMSIGLAYGEWEGIIVLNSLMLVVLMFMQWDNRRLLMRIHKAILDDDGGVRFEVRGALRTLWEVLKEARES